MSPSDQPIPFPGVAVPPAGATGAAHATDARLLAEVAAGHSGALAELYRLRGGALLALIQRIVTDEREAEEVLQDTFVQFWRRAGTYDAAKSGPFTWMVMLARGLALDRLRRHARRQATLEEYRTATPGAPSDDQTGLTTALEGEAARRITHALSGIPPEQRQAIELAFWRGCTQDEIARTTGEPLGTIKARIRRGMLTLRHKLRDWHE